MKLKQISKAYIVRTLACLSFVIFFCPFLQTCSNEEIKNLPRFRGVTDKDVIKDNLINAQENFTYNAYIFAIIPFKDFKIQALLEIDFYFLLIMDFIMIISLLIIYFSFRNKFYKLKISTLICVLLLSIYLLYFICDSIIEEITQIKYGYYLFLINLILIIYFSNQLIKEQKN